MVGILNIYCTLPSKECFLIHHLILIFKASLRDRASKAERTGVRQLPRPVFRVKCLSLSPYSAFFP